MHERQASYLTLVTQPQVQAALAPLHTPRPGDLYWTGKVIAPTVNELYLTDRPWVPRLGELWEVLERHTGRAWGANLSEFAVWFAQREDKTNLLAMLPEECWLRYFMSPADTQHSFQSTTKALGEDHRD